jgi:hypothetical protein
MPQIFKVGSYCIYFLGNSFFLLGIFVLFNKRKSVDTK